MDEAGNLRAPTAPPAQGLWSNARGRIAAADLRAGTALAVAELLARHWLGAPPDRRPARRNGRVTKAMGLDFGGPLGAAAGFDRRGALAPALAALGLSFVELGSVTACADRGPCRRQLNTLVRALPRLHRRLPQTNPPVRFGVSVSMDPRSRWREAHTAFGEALKAVWLCADYVTINLSHPNVALLAEAEQRLEVKPFLGRLSDVREALDRATGRAVPLAIKVAIPPSSPSPPPILRAVRELGYSGAVVTVTERRSEGAVPRPALSPAAILRMSREVLGNQAALIAVGGVRSPQSLRDRLAAGADLVQVYRALIYDGPAAVARLCDAADRIVPDPGRTMWQ